MIALKQFLVGIVVFSLSLTTQCSVTSTTSSNSSYRFSFETDLSGWTPRGTDLALGDSTIDWSIALSKDRATDGQASLKYYLNNLNDAGKIWIESGFFVDPLRKYKVKIAYDFASRDYGTFNLFTIITGVFQGPPRTRDELQPAYQGETGNGSATDVGYQWMPKEYEFTVDSGSASVLYVVIGVWGRWETARTYYIDNVRLTFTQL